VKVNFFHILMIMYFVVGLGMIAFAADPSTDSDDSGGQKLSLDQGWPGAGHPTGPTAWLGHPPWCGARRPIGLKTAETHDSKVRSVPPPPRVPVVGEN
jgi:hypothetical protein